MAWWEQLPGAFSCQSAKNHARGGSLFVWAMASKLARDMLNAYLDGKMSDSLVKDLTAAVAGHPTFDKIKIHVQNKVQDWVNSVRSLPGQQHLRELVSNSVDTFRMMSPAAAVGGVSKAGPAYFSGDLQAVIGGIHGMTMVSSNIKRQSAGDMDYEVSIAIRDSYDFDNDRSMFPFYDNFRKELARLYMIDKIQFMTTYLQGMASAPLSGPGNAVTGPLSAPDVFTCFMYAIEKGGCTAPLLWEVQVPFTTSAKLP